MLYVKELPRKMKIPLQSEIAKFMQEKMGWHETFCNYYADKFWNYYNAQGWKLSNGNSMKNWQSAFLAQWQKPKDPEAIEMLKRLNKVELNRMENKAACQYLDAILMSYKNGFKPDRETALKLYDYLKNHGIMKLPKDKIEEAVNNAGNDRDKGKLWCLKFYFDAMIEKNLTFTSLLNG